MRSDTDPGFFDESDPDQDFSDGSDLEHILPLSDSFGVKDCSWISQLPFLPKTKMLDYAKQNGNNILMAITFLKT